VTGGASKHPAHPKPSLLTSKVQLRYNAPLLGMLFVANLLASTEKTKSKTREITTKIKTTQHKLPLEVSFVQIKKTMED